MDIKLGSWRRITRKLRTPIPISLHALKALLCLALWWAALSATDAAADGLRSTHPPTKLGSGGTFDASGVTLLSRIPVEAFPGSNAAANDLWGYVSPSGREYALMGLQNGTAFVEVTDPEAPVIVGFIPHAATCCSDIKVYLQYAYVVLEAPGGLQTIDLSNIDAGLVTLADTFGASILTGVHNIAINEESGYAYLCGGVNAISDGGLYVVDLADPVNPAFAGAWSDTFVHDAQVVTYTDGPFSGKEIAFAYTAGDAQLSIIDVTNKSAMTVIGSTTYPNAAYAHQGCLSEDRQHVYLNDEGDEITSGIPTTTYVIDVGDLTQPTFVTSFSNGLSSIDHNLVVRENFIFEANYTSGLRIYNAANPFLIEEVGYFDTYPADDLPGFMGAWSAYAGLPSGNIIVSDIQSGLFVLDPLQALCGGANLFFEEGDRLELTLPDPVDLGQTIQWRKNGVDLLDDGRITGSNSIALIIDPVELDDSGTYSATYDDGSRAPATFCPVTVEVSGPLSAMGVMGLGALAAALIACCAVVLRASKP